MAEENYMQQNNGARQQARVSRRKRIDGLLDPMESAATMDRLQGADVGGGFSGAVDSPSANILPLVMRGGGGGDGGGDGGSGLATTVQTVANRGGLRQFSPPAQGGCKDGQCGIPRSTVTSAPTATTTASAPAATTVSRPPPSTTPVTPEGLYSQARERSSAATGVARSNPTEGAMLRDEARGLRGDADAMALQERAKRVDDADIANAAEAAKSARILAESEAVKNRGEAAASFSTADLADEATGIKYAAKQDQLLSDVVLSGKSPSYYADARLKMDANTMSSVNKSDTGVAVTMQPQLGPDVEKKRQQYMREGFAAHAVYMLTTSEQFNEEMRSRPADQVGVARVGGMVGKDPKTGAPVEFKEDAVYAKTAERRKNESISRSMEAMASGYAANGALGTDWNTLNARLYNDVGAPMTRFMRAKYEEANAAEINSVPPEYRAEAIEAVRGRADKHVNDWFVLVQKEMAIHNRAAGGGTPDNPSGSPLFTPRKPVDGGATGGFGKPTMLQ